MLKPFLLTLGNEAIPDAEWVLFVIMKYKEYIGILQYMGSLQCSHQDAYTQICDI